jgi:methylmalonyl-CoA/ethylmalonyl-CoA epimerase
MQKMRINFHHSGVSVDNLDAAIKWYSEKLGFKLEKRHKMPNMDAEVAFMRNGDIRFELFDVANAADLPEGRKVPDEDLKTRGNKHVAFVVEDIVATHEELKSRDVDIVWVKKFEFGGVMFIRDNTGNLIEFIEGAPPIGELSFI